MNTAILSAMAIVLGALVGAAATIATSWITDTGRAKLKAIRADV
jgi:hypothetical protein